MLFAFFSIFLTDVKSTSAGHDTCKLY